MWTFICLNFGACRVWPKPSDAYTTKVPPMNFWEATSTSGAYGAIVGSLEVSHTPEVRGNTWCMWLDAWMITSQCAEHHRQAVNPWRPARRHILEFYLKPNMKVLVILPEQLVVQSPIHTSDFQINVYMIIMLCWIHTYPKLFLRSISVGKQAWCTA